jgi:hypothetical protein
MTPRFKGNMNNLLLPKFRTGDHVWSKDKGEPGYKAVVLRVDPKPEPEKGFIYTIAVPLKSPDDKPRHKPPVTVDEDILTQVEYSPLEITCGCGFKFTLTREGQKFYFERGFVLPKRCKKCRDEKKSSQRAAS